MKEMRNLVISGVQYLITTCKDATQNSNSTNGWHGFWDVSIAVSTSILNSSNCENLDIHEVAHFVKFTEKLNDSMTDIEPMSIMFGVVTKKTNSKPPYTCRDWSDFKPRFETGEARADPHAIPRMASDLHAALDRACLEVTDADFTKMEMLN